GSRAIGGVKTMSRTSVLLWAVHSIPAILWGGLVAGTLQSTVWAGTTGSISGTVTDPTGSVVPGATLTVTSTTQGVQHKARSDAKGAYTFPSLPVGQYRLEVEGQ